MFNSVVRLYSIFDRVAMDFGPLFEAKNDSVAFRSFLSIMAKENLNSGDYRLYCHGTVSRGDGVLEVSDCVSREITSPVGYSEDDVNGK